MPLFKDDLLILQDQAYANIVNTLKGIGGPFVVFGCVAVDAGGGNVLIGSGTVFIDNELITFPGYLGAYPAYVKQGTPVQTTKVYFDGSTQTVYEENTTQVVTSVPGSGEYLTFNFDTTQRMNNKIVQNTRDSYLSTPWVDLDSAFLRYRRDGIGNVTVIGVIGFGGSATNRVLPVGFRPGVSTSFKGIGIHDITIGTDGTIATPFITGAGTERRIQVNFSFKAV
jgi:hypothetical protein